MVPDEVFFLLDVVVVVESTALACHTNVICIISFPTCDQCYRTTSFHVEHNGRNGRISGLTDCLTLLSCECFGHVTGGFCWRRRRRRRSCLVEQQDKNKLNGKHVTGFECCCGRPFHLPLPERGNYLTFLRLRIPSLENVDSRKFC